MINGATSFGSCVNFTIHSQNAVSCELLLFHRGEKEPYGTIPFPENYRIGRVYSMIVFGLDIYDFEYAYRMDGPNVPEKGLIYDKTKVLLDPYARAVTQQSIWGKEPDREKGYHGRVVFNDFDWGDAREPKKPMQELIIYEMHVRGFTKHASSGVQFPGTFEGIREKIPYLKALGITAVELMPVFEFDETMGKREIGGRTLLDYWGYNTVGFFAPNTGYTARQEYNREGTEFKNLIRELHQNGIEVILDVVFNHTAEGNEQGPFFEFKGIDNRIYYMLTPEGNYYNFSGCGNTLNCNHPVVQQMILECLRHQFQDGHAVLTWYPYDDTRYSDQPFWIIWAVCELIKETGDYTILQKKIEWQDGGAAAVVEHLKAAADCLIRDKGRNGLSRIYFADWNDALNITTDPEAESVMLSHQFCLAFRELKLLMEKIGETDYAEFLKKEYDTMRKTINEKAWDGEWYMRALSKKENIGSRTSEGSKIYLNAQTWAVLGDVVDEEKLPKLLTAVDSMEHDFGFPLNMPPYEKYSPNVGRMSGMLPGLFENGGVYCHATGFKILMDCKLGRVTKAVSTLKKIMPDSEKNPSTQSGAEPYVFTNCYSTHPKYYGKSYWSWTTGTSAWCMNGLYEGIMGVKRRYDGLEISPCFPAEWNRAEMTRHFRNADYHIIIENPQHIESGKPIVSVDGVQIEGNRLPDFADGSRHEVKVVLR